MKNAKKTIIAAAVVLLCATGYFIYYQINKSSASDTEPAQDVYVDSTAGKVIATGNVYAKDEVLLYVETAQTVSKINVKEGDSVKIGDVLVEYDISQTKKDLERKLDEAQINLSNAKLALDSIVQPASGNELLAYTSELNAAVKNITVAENDLKSLDIKIAQQQLLLDDAKRTFEKTEVLFKSGFSPQNQYDLALTNYQNAEKAMNDLLLAKESKAEALQMRMDQKADAEQRIENASNKLGEQTNVIRYQQQENTVKLAQLAVDTIKDELDKLSEATLSTVNGIVLSVNVVEGGVATKPNYVIKLSDTSDIIVKADITEYDAPLLKLGQKSEITTSGLPDKIYYGEITKIADNAVEKEKPSGKEVVVPIEITLTNADEMLKTGYTVDVEVYVE